MWEEFIDGRRREVVCGTGDNSMEPGSGGRYWAKLVKQNSIQGLTEGETNLYF